VLLVNVADYAGAIGNSFTPWFKLIARDFLFGWWDELLARKQNGVVNAKSLEGVVDGSKVVKMT
jgi:isopentenyl-diphosphate delta-isomerase